MLKSSTDIPLCRFSRSSLNTGWAPTIVINGVMGPLLMALQMGNWGYFTTISYKWSSFAVPYSMVFGPTLYLQVFFSKNNNDQHRQCSRNGEKTDNTIAFFLRSKRGLQALQKLQVRSSQEIYWSYLGIYLLFF